MRAFCFALRGATVERLGGCFPVTHRTTEALAGSCVVASRMAEPLARALPLTSRTAEPCAVSLRVTSTTREPQGGCADTIVCVRACTLACVLLPPHECDGSVSAGASGSRVGRPSLSPPPLLSRVGQPSPSPAPCPLTSRTGYLHTRAHTWYLRCLCMLRHTRGILSGPFSSAVLQAKMERPRSKLQELQSELSTVQSALTELRRKRRLTEDAARRPRGTRVHRVSAERTARVLLAAGEAASDGAAADVFRRRNLPAQCGATVETVAPPHPGAAGSVEPLADVPGLPEARGASAGRSPSPAAGVGDDSPSAIRAATFLQEFDLHRWVHDLNDDCGVAPSSASVWSRWQTLRETAGGVPGVGAERLARSRKHQLQWVRRWRQRWLVRYRAVPTGAALTRASLGEKAPRETDSGGAFSWNWGNAAAEEGGALSGPVPLGKKKGGPRMGPIFRPPKTPLSHPSVPANVRRSWRLCSGTLSWRVAAPRTGPCCVLTWTRRA